MLDDVRAAADWLMRPVTFKRRWHVLIVLLAITEVATWAAVLIVRAQ
jgi:hypothetical protein